MRIVKGSGKASNSAMNEYACGIDKRAAPFRGGKEVSGRGRVRAHAGKTKKSR